MGPIVGYTQNEYTCGSATLTEAVGSSTPQRPGKLPRRNLQSIKSIALKVAMALAAAP